MVGASDEDTVFTNMIGFFPLARIAMMFEIPSCDELFEFTISSGRPR